MKFNPCAQFAALPGGLYTGREVLSKLYAVLSHGPSHDPLTEIVPSALVEKVAVTAGGFIGYEDEYAMETRVGPAVIVTVWADATLGREITTIKLNSAIREKIP